MFTGFKRFAALLLGGNDEIGEYERIYISQVISRLEYD